MPYPWDEGDRLTFTDLNAAIAETKTVAQQGLTLGLNNQAGVQTAAGSATAAQTAATASAASAALAASLNLSALSSGFAIATGATTARSLADRFADTLHLKDFGAVGDGVTDDSDAIQRAVTAATNNTLFASPGSYVISRTITGTGPITIQGSSMGAGPGVIGQSVARFICAPGFTAGDMFQFTSLFGVQFRDLQIVQAGNMAYTVPSTRGAGAAVYLLPPGSPGATNGSSSFERVCIAGFDTQIKLERANVPRVTGCYFMAWKTAAIDANCGPVASEGSCGNIHNNFFFGDTTPGTAQQFGVRMSQGYGTISSNLFVGAREAIRVNVNDLVNIGSIIIAMNSIEEQLLYGVNIVQSGVVAADAIQVINNEFSNLSNQGIAAHIAITAAVSADLYLIDVSGNKFQSFLTGTGGNGVLISIQAGNNVRVANNQCTGSGFMAVAIAAAVTNCLVADNQISGTGLQGSYGGYQFNNSTTVLRDLYTRAITVANLNANGEGSQIYVADGQQSSDSGIVIAGGSGCIAFRNNGQWVTIPTLTTGVRTNGAAGPIWIAGAGAPASTQPLGSLWSRTDGGVGTTLYVSRGGGTWNPVAGV